MNRRFAFLALFSGAVFSYASYGAIIAIERVASGLTSPLFATSAPGDASRLFIVEQGSGTSANIKLLDLTTRTVLPTPFLTINNITTGGERGLLGLAFDPSYSANGRFFVNYTDASGHTQIERYSVSGNPNVANSASAFPILRVNQPFANHNGGWLGFGPDNNLYIGMGDGGSGNDPNNHAQSISDGSLLGKMLRIDVSGNDAFADPLRNYAIPAGNPFAGAAGDDEIWSYGLRNPWRNSFDRVTGDLYIADVGEGAREEVNFQPANSTGGVNYGWRAKEGSVPTPGISDPIPANAVDPIHEYNHVAAPDGGFSITGGYVYRGTLRPDLVGHYFFADYVSQQIWSFKVVNGVKTEFVNRTSEFVTDVGTIDSISSFGQDAAGELYIVDHGGEVFAVVPEPAETASVTALVLLAVAWVHAKRRRLS